MILLAATATALFPKQGQAQYPYIQIADVVVDASNQDNITSDYISGTIRYDSTTRTLTLENVSISYWESSIDYDDGRALWVSGAYQCFTIELIGNNVLNGLVPLSLNCGKFYIKGPGSLTLNGLWRGLECDVGTDSVSICQDADVRISMTSQYHPVGIVGSTYGNVTTTLVIDNSRLVISAYRCIRSIAGVQLIDSHIATPEGACFNPDSMSIVTTSGEIVTGFLEIQKGTVGLSENEAFHLKAWGVEGGIHIENLEEGQAVEVVNMLGRVVYSAKKGKTEVFVPLKHGVYVVQSKDYATKVVVK